MARRRESRRRRITATGASRSSSSILDPVERGRRFVVRRRGRDVCLMSPPEVDGRTATECLTLLRGRARSQLDDRFGDDLTAVLKGEAPEDRSSRGS